MIENKIDKRKYGSIELTEFKEQEDSLIVEGYAVVFEQPTMIAEFEGIKAYEVIDRNAFSQSQMADVVFVVNHEGTPAARTRNGTLELRIDDYGLYVRADLSKSSIGQSVYQDIKNGVYDRMSFSFIVQKEERDPKTRTRRILAINRLFDVSCVTFAAYEQTNILARSQLKAEVEAELLEKRELETRKKRIEMLLQLSRKE